MFSDNPDFYPTPAKVALKMLERVSKDAENFLEPSAGKGDLADIIKRKGEDGSYNRNYNRHRVDCIEIEPDLVAALRGKEYSVVGYDWLTYSGVSYYDAILMNPPFSNGDEHLLKAWEFMWDGEIVCLLNEETVRNPHTKNRQRLAEIIKNHGDVTFLGDCFKTAQRSTDVRVAMVYLRKKSEAEDLSDLWAKDAQEKSADDTAGDDALERMLAIPDVLGNLEHYYNMANEHMLKAFNHIRKASLYSQAGSFSGGCHSREDGKELKEIMELALSNVNHARAEWGRSLRRNAWMSVFDKMQFHKWLDSKQQEQFLRDVQRDANIPFTADNIKGTLENVISQRKRLFEQSCANVFDALTEHYWENGVSEGWKTNDNFKVNQKLIFPYGAEWDPGRPFQGYKPKGEWRTWSERSSAVIYTDLDRILCVLEGKPFEECYTAGEALRHRMEQLNRMSGYQSNEQVAISHHFEIQFYKKGTLHLKFRDLKLWERFNAACAAGKLWLGMNTNGRDEFPGRRTRYRNGRQEEIVDPPMPADPMALINQFRREYGAGEREEVAPAPVVSVPELPTPEPKPQPTKAAKIAANEERIAQLQRMLAAQQQSLFGSEAAVVM